MKYFSLFFLTAILLQCTGMPADKQQTKEQTETTSEVETAAVPSYPSISSDQMRYLWDNCDYVDFIFYETNFSMSQNDQNAIRSTLSGVATSVAEVKATCKPVGRVFFQVNGVNQEEADLFFGGECLYYLFFKDGEYAYANQLTEAGFNFYKNVFEQVKTQSQ